MSSPNPYGKSSLNNSPLLADGSDFPCKQRSGVYADTAANVMPLGSTQPLTFVGSATHGGGSCQISITYDQEPTTSSVWKVIHSIEGGCPIQGVAGNNGDNANAVDPSTYSFTIPTDLPTGTATLAWTWFNKVGNREMYMNCAPISLTASSSKRSIEEDDLVANITQLVQRDTAAYDALPDMFVANIGNGCGTQDSTDLLFPNPGDSVEKLGTATSSALATPTGSCQAVVAGSGSSGTTAAASQATTAAASTATNAAAAGGVFITTGPAAVASSATAASAASVVATTLATSAAAAQATSATAATVVSPSSSASSSSSGSTVSGLQTGACNDEGAWLCLAGTQYQRCASGTWSVAMSVAAGTECTGSGVSDTINIVASSAKRSRRNVHVRRHALHST